MKPQYHLATSLALGGGLWLGGATSSLSASAALAGVLIDADHYLDHAVSHGPTLDLKKFVEDCRNLRLKKVYHLFHSIELITALAIFGWVLEGITGSILMGIVLGSSLHIFFDILFNPIRPGTYFFFFRLSRGFEMKRCFKIPPCSPCESPADI